MSIEDTPHGRAVLCRVISAHLYNGMDPHFFCPYCPEYYKKFQDLRSHVHQNHAGTYYVSSGAPGRSWRVDVNMLRPECTLFDPWFRFAPHGLFYQDWKFVTFDGTTLSFPYVVGQYTESETSPDQHLNQWNLHLWTHLPANEDMKELLVQGSSSASLICDPYRADAVLPDFYGYAEMDKIIHEGTHGEGASSVPTALHNTWYGIQTGQANPRADCFCVWSTSRQSYTKERSDFDTIRSIEDTYHPTGYTISDLMEAFINHYQSLCSCRKYAGVSGARLEYAIDAVNRPINRGAEMSEAIHELPDILPARQMEFNQPDDFDLWSARANGRYSVSFENYPHPALE